MIVWESGGGGRGEGRGVLRIVCEHEDGLCATGSV